MKNYLFDISTYVNGVRQICGCLGELENDENGEKMDNSNIYIMELFKNSRKIVFCNSVSSKHQMDRCQRKNSSSDCRYEVQDMDKDTVYKRCRLWSDLVNGEKLSHDERFLLATNVVYMKGFEHLFMKWIKQYYDSEVKWRVTLGYIKAENYKPTSCTRCPYHHICLHGKNIIQTVTGRKCIVRLEDEPSYIPVDMGYQYVFEYLTQAILAQDRDIHLIKAQTGIGKTEAYVNFIKQKKGGKPVLIAAPLVKLKSDIAGRLSKSYGVQILSWEQLPLPAEIKSDVESIYKMGYYKDAKSVIKEYTKKKEPSPCDIDFQEYFDGMNILEKDETNVVVTHAQLMNIPEKILEKYEIVIDEDYLYASLRNMGSISVGDIELLIDSGNISGNKLEALQRMIADNGSEYFVNNCSDYKIYKKQEDMKQLGIEGDVNSFLNADAYHRLEKDGGIFIEFFKAPKLPKQKVTILSATLDKEIYQLFFKDRRITFEEVPKVKYQGRLIQYTNHSMSRKRLDMLCPKETSESIREQTFYGTECSIIIYEIKIQELSYNLRFYKPCFQTYFNVLDSK